MQKRQEREERRRFRMSERRVLLKRQSLKRIARLIGKYLAAAVCGYLLSSLALPFNTRPLGVALLASATEALPALLIGAVIGAMTVDKTPLIYLSTFSALVLLRLFLSIMSDETAPARKSHPFEDSFFARALCALVISFVIGIYKLIAGGFRYYDLAGVFFLAAASLIGTFLFSICLDRGFCERLAEKLTRARPVVTAASEVLRLILLSVLLYSARSLRVGIFSLSVAAAFFLTVILCRDLSTLRASVTGLMLGLGSGLATAPLFMLSGALSSLLYKISPLSAVISALLCTGVWGGYVGGASAVSVLLPSTLPAAALVLLLDRISHTHLEATDGKSVVQYGDDGLASQRLSDRDGQLRALSSAFSSLSELFYNLCDRLRRPGMLDLRRMCDGAFDLYCPGCPNRELCWGLEYSSTLEVLGALSEHLHTHGRVGLESLPDYMKARCECTEEIIAEINRRCARMTEEALKSEKTEVFALDYESMARILCDTIESDDEEYQNNAPLAESISKYLYDCGLGQTTVVCFGGRRKQIIARGMGPFRAAIYSDHLRRDIEELSGYSLIGPTFERGDGYSPPSMVFSARPKIRAACVCRSVASDGERIFVHDFDEKLGIYGTGAKEAADANGVFSVFNRTDIGDKKESGEGEWSRECGDTVNLFVSRKDNLYALVSDGMGTGEEAAFTSKICSVFLEKMLTAGNSVETSLRMLNGFVRSKGAECSASVDLLELDLLLGIASFVKSGAAQSYVVRDGNIYRLMSKTVPIGIIKAIDAERMKIDVHDGDLIVMVSDGVTQGSENCTWLCELLSAEGSRPDTDLDLLAERIISGARKTARLMGLERYDDASVILIRLSEFGEDDIS